MVLGGSRLESSLLLGPAYGGYVDHRLCIPLPQAGDSASVGLSSLSVKCEGAELRLLQAVYCHVPSPWSPLHPTYPYHTVCEAVTPCPLCGRWPWAVVALSTVLQLRGLAAPSLICMSLSPKQGSPWG